MTEESSGRILTVVGLSTIAAIGGLAGCANFETVVPAGSDFGSLSTDGGGIYYLPRQPIQLTLVVDKDDASLVTPSLVTAPSVIPDTAQAFLLKYPRNLVGTNHLTVTISPDGLLSSINSTNTTSVPAIVSSLGSIAGAVSALDKEVAKPPQPPPSPNCVKGATYTVTIFPEEFFQRGTNNTLSDAPCGLNITLERKFDVSTANALPPRGSDRATVTYGIYYKQQMPYVLTVKARDGAHAPNQFLAFSPDEAPPRFLPSEKSLFANATSNVTISNGILGGYEKSTDSEIGGLVAIPAQFINAYFSAAGAIFGSLTSLNGSRAAQISSSSSLAAEQAKHQYCLLAIATNKVGPSTSAQDAQAAYTAISTACAP